jgi:hypothetical protein
MPLVDFYIHLISQLKIGIASNESKGDKSEHELTKVISTLPQDRKITQMNIINNKDKINMAHNKSIHKAFQLIA